MPEQDDPIKLEDVWQLVGMLYLEAWSLRKKLPELQAQVTALTQKVQQLQSKATVLTVDRSGAYVSPETGETYDVHATSTGVSDAA